MTQSNHDEYPHDVSITFAGTQWSVEAADRGTEAI